MQDEDFTEIIKRCLQNRVAHMCSNPICRRLTVRRQTDTEGYVHQGIAAHIHGVEPGSARYDPTIPDDVIRSFSNGIWLCDICSRMVDDDEAVFPPDKLRIWKTKAEEYVAELITQDTCLRR